MPISSVQLKAICLNQARWRSRKHLRAQARILRGKHGVGFLNDLDRARNQSYVERHAPIWSKEPYYRLTEKAHRYLRSHGYATVIEAFRMAEPMKLSASLAELQSHGWYSSRHVGVVAATLIDEGYYETALFKRKKKRTRFFRLTSKGKNWAKERIKAAAERQLRSEFKARRAEVIKEARRLIRLKAELVKAWAC